MKKILIITGDPNSINSEIIFKVWKKMKDPLKKKIFFISNYDLIRKQFKLLKYKINPTKVSNLEVSNNKFKILNINLKFNNPFDVDKKYSSKYVLDSFNMAHRIALSSKIAGIINCPINKELLNKKNFGITELLASKCKVQKNSEVMLIRNKKLSVSPITTHINLKDVSKKLNKNLIVKKILTINSWFLKNNKKKAKIGILGLNPHNGELRKNSEEKKIIIPAIKKLKKFGINLKGPFVADTIFIRDFKNFDVIVGMYHDQVLAPFKSIFKFDAINVTLGLKYNRVSPDHGVASNLIKKNKASEKSLAECINFLKNL